MVEIEVRTALIMLAMTIGIPAFFLVAKDFTGRVPLGASEVAELRVGSCSGEHLLSAIRAGDVVTRSDLRHVERECDDSEEDARWRARVDAAGAAQRAAVERLSKSVSKG